MTDVQQTFERLVSLAIQREEEAYDFYMKAAEESKFKSSAKLLHDLANQEITHKEKLKEALDAGVCDTFTCDTVEDIETLCIYAHKYNAKVYVTVNTLLDNQEIIKAQQLVYKLLRQA